MDRGLSNKGKMEELEREPLEQALLAVYHRGSLLSDCAYLSLLEKVNRTLESEGTTWRPNNAAGLPGGVVYLDSGLPALIVPDLHGRMDFLLSIFLGDQTDALRGLGKGTLQVVCTGDGFHGEARVIHRWFGALEEYSHSFSSHDNMDREMIESLGVMEMIMLVKIAYPRLFHFLKGNHENVMNECGGGNYPFMKFTNEGAMVKEYVEKFLGRAFLDSHSEPKRFFPLDEIAEYGRLAHVVEGLTWTDNGHAEEGSVRQMIESYIGEEHRKKALYFGGHRPVVGMFNTRAEGQYVQIHNPNRFIVAAIGAEQEIELERDVIEIENITGGFETAVNESSQNHI